MKLVSFKTEDKLELPGFLYEPGHKTDKIAIFLHGNGSSSVIYDVDLMNEIGAALNKKNLAFFPFNNRGSGYIKSFHLKENGEDKRIKMGTTYELIKDCVIDIDGAIKFLKALNYKDFYLIGISTGANKIVVYNYYKQDNNISKYILLSGGDDTGLYFQAMTGKKFKSTLLRCKEEVNKGNGAQLVPRTITTEIMSYQSLYDTINPDGDYNIFPFNEYINNLNLSKKQLFKEYKKIAKPTLIIYGELDEYCYGDVPSCLAILQKESSDLKLFTFKLIKGADHGFNGYEKKLAKSIADWI